MSHRLLAAQLMALAQHLVQQMAELPCGNAILLQRLAQRDRPERVGAMRVERADDGGACVFRFQRRLDAVQRFADADGLCGWPLLWMTCTLFIREIIRVRHSNLPAHNIPCPTPTLLCVVVAAVFFSVRATLHRTV